MGISRKRKRVERENSNRGNGKGEGVQVSPRLGDERADLHLNHKPGRIAPLLVTKNCLSESSFRAL